MPPRVRFDVPTLTEHLNVADPLTLILRAHLYVETVLLARISGALANKRALNLSRMPFSLKVKLALALARIDEADAAAFTALNRLRNKFAHDLRTELNDQDEQSLHRALTPARRKIVNNMIGARKMPVIARLRCDLVALIIEHE